MHQVLDDAAITRRRAPSWARFVLAFGCWTLLGLFEASQLYLTHSSRGEDVSLARSLGMGMSLWYAWGILAVFVFKFARRFPIEQRNWPRRILLHLFAGGAFAAIRLVMDYPIIALFYCPLGLDLPFATFYKMGFTSHFHPYVLIYWALLGVSHALSYHRQFRDRELRASHLETRFAQTELKMLKMQMQPHFLFNTLHSISALIYQDIDTADRMLSRLGDLLRLTFDRAGVDVAPLAEEVEFVRSYLEIEEVRYGDRLQVSFDIAPDTVQAQVPYLILQPLVENAIRHGVAARSRPGRVVIRSRQAHGFLTLQVEDDGPGLRPNGNSGRRGIGLANTLARLEQLYGRDHFFELRNRREGGALATITIPYTDNGATLETTDENVPQPA